MSQETVARPTLRHGIAEEVRVLLARRRMSATKLAEELGWSQPYMARRMNGAQPFDADDLQAVAAALGVNIVDLLPRKEREVTVRYPPSSTNFDSPTSAGRAPVAAVMGVATYPIRRPDLARSAVISQPPPGRHRTAPTGLLG